MSNVRWVVAATVAAVLVFAAPATAAADGTYYKSCDEVRAAGAAPLHEGQPGYRKGLDRDGDGIACDTDTTSTTTASTTTTTTLADDEPQVEPEATAPEPVAVQPTYTG